MTFAMVFPVSTHNYEIRYWMAAAGIDPDRDVQLIVIPPPQMVATLESKAIDGYCVGEPWNARAVTAGIGHTLITSYEIWNNSPEKVFGVTAVRQKYPNTHRAALMALIRPRDGWTSRTTAEVVRIISRPLYVNAPGDVVDVDDRHLRCRRRAPRPLPDFNVLPLRRQLSVALAAVWFLTRPALGGQSSSRSTSARPPPLYRPDLYRDAPRRWVPAPVRRQNRRHARRTWTLSEASAPIAMGPDRFFDGRVFDPAKPIDYLAGFDIRSPNIALAALAAVNERATG
jgi:nitrate/nitrite transport system substrate-binding protein